MSRRQATANAVPSPIRRAVLETLEQRRLLAFTGTNFALPWHNDFSGDRFGVHDVNGVGTGFPIVQGNSTGDEYQPQLIEIDTDAGVLLLTSRGNAQAGSNFGDDNTLANGLQVPFDARSGPWTIHTRVTDFNAPLSQFSEAFEQAGILYGPTQDNFIKLVFGHDGSNYNVQFLTETRDGDQFNYPAGTDGFKSVINGNNGTNLGTAEFIDLWLSGDPATGTVSAQYRVQGATTVRFEDTYSFTGELYNRFFRAREARAGIMVAHKHDGQPITAAFDQFTVQRREMPSDRPAVLNVRPGPGETDVARDSFFAVDLELPNAGISAATLSQNTVRLIRISDGKQVPATVNTTGGGDAIILAPDRVLDAQTQYRFEITSGVTDLFGVAMAPYTQTITTGYDIAQAGGNVAFDQISLPDTQGTRWTSVEMGPDNRLYATSVTGQIVRWDVNANGSLSGRQEINSITNAEGGPRVVTGIAFAPGATAQNLVAYVTHTHFNDVTVPNPSEPGEDWTGKITRLSGATLQNVHDVVVGLPRSIRDHLTNQPRFGPDGLLYVPQGANSAMGAPDAAWGFRPERRLSASVLAVDVQAISENTINVRTDGSNPYDPLAPGAPVRFFATGVRNAYDLVWHSNGRLYVPTNGSAAGGNTPESPQPNDPAFGANRVDIAINGPFTGDFVPGLNNVSQTQNDYLFQVVQGGFYGHPNPTRDEWVMNGGNPTGGTDPAEVTAYPVGTQPDRNWRGFAYDFGKNQSANGIIEYTDNSFGGALQGRLIVARFSGGNDLIVLDLDDQGRVINAQEGVAGFSGFNDPLDLIQGPGGSIYVAEFGGQEITLLRPIEEGGQAGVTSRRIFTHAAPGETATALFTVTNTGDRPLLLSSYTLTLTGQDRQVFNVDDAPLMAVAVPPGQTYTYEVEFTPPASATAGDVLEAMVSVRTNDPNAPEIGSRIFGLITQSDAEASLQLILDLYGFGINTGDNDPGSADLPSPGGDLVQAPLFQAADASRPVTMVPIASFGPAASAGNRVAQVGFYTPGRPALRQPVQDILGANSVAPEYRGAVKFDHDGPFGLYMEIDEFLDNGRPRITYSEPQLNTWEPDAAERRKVIAFPAKLADGTVVPNSFVIAFEEWHVANDFNDVVMILSNVQPVTDTAGRLAVLPQFAVPFTDRLIFSTIDPAFRDHGSVPGGDQMVRESQPLVLRNVGTAPIQVTGATATGTFSVTGFTPTTLAVGEQMTFNVNFTETQGATTVEQRSQNRRSGVLTVQTNTSQTIEMDLRGFFQPWSEDDWRRSGVGKGNMEPFPNDMLWLLGLDTRIGTDAQLDNNGTVEAIGDELLSPYWQMANPHSPVEVLQIAAFHGMNTADAISWFPQGSPSTPNLILRHEQAWGQSIMPLIQGGNGPAFATFSTDPEQVFGFRVVNELSDPTLNNNPAFPGQPAHHLRYWPIYDEAGNLKPDTYLMLQDFDGFNYDYNDNVYLIRNIQPASLAPAPGPANGFRGTSGAAVVNWGAPEASGLFNVYRSAGNRSNFTLLTDSPVRRGFFVDENAPAGTAYYRVVAVDGQGNESLFSDARIA